MKDLLLQEPERLLILRWTVTTITNVAFSLQLFAVCAIISTAHENVSPMSSFPSDNWINTSLHNQTMSKQHHIVVVVVVVVVY